MSSDLARAMSNVPILVGQTNYREWNLQIKSTARYSSIWKAIQGKDKAVTSDVPDVAALEAREEKAIGLITGTVSPHLKIELDEYRVPDSKGTHEPSAAELWTYLQQRFEKKDTVSAVFDYSRLAQAALVDDGTLEEQLNTLQELRSRCALNNLTFEDWQFAVTILIALPASYESVKEHFLITHDPMKLKPEDVRARILERQLRKKQEQDQSAANIIQTKSPAAKNQKRANRPPDNRPCYNCGKKGHWARECRAPKKDNSTNKSSPGPSKAGGSSLNVVETSDAESDSPVLCYFGAPENWLMDSGATDHMTPYGSDFKDYTKYAESRTVILGDGSTRLNIIGKGTIERWVEIAPHVYRQIILQDALHVEGIKRRFLSIGRFDDRGFTVAISNSRLTISKGKTSFTGWKTGPLYTCSLYAEKPLGVAHAICMNHYLANPNDLNKHVNTKRRDKIKR